MSYRADQTSSFDQPLLYQISPSPHQTFDNTSCHPSSGHYQYPNKTNNTVSDICRLMYLRVYIDPFQFEWLPW